MKKQAIILFFIVCLLAEAPRNLNHEGGSSLANYSQKAVSNLGGACNLNCGWYTIEVSGASTLNLSPDTALVSLQVTAGGPTTNDAITALSLKINQILNVLTSSGAANATWTTNYLYTYANTTYINGTYVTVGQIAYEGLTLTIPIVNANGAILGTIYDGLAQVENINIYGLSFDLKDKKQALQGARALAYVDAQQRAKDYAYAAGVLLRAPITIIDSYSSSYTNSPTVKTITTPVSPTVISVGTISVSYNLNILYGFQ